MCSIVLLDKLKNRFLCHAISISYIAHAIDPNRTVSHAIPHANSLFKLLEPVAILLLGVLTW